jgi:hypothetical protein
MLDKIKKLFTKEAPKTNLSIKELKVGYIVDYFMESWEVKSHGEYSFDGGSYGAEFLIDNGKRKQFLYVEEDGTLDHITLSETLALNSIDPAIRTQIINTDNAPNTFDYQGEAYFFVECSAGLFKDYKAKEEDASEFVMYDFKNKAEDKFISITRWSETELEAAAGQSIKEYEFSNILPK